MSARKSKEKPRTVTLNYTELRKEFIKKNIQINQKDNRSKRLREK